MSSKNAEKIKVVEKERELPPIEEIDAMEYAENIRRYENAIINNLEGLPADFTKLDDISMRQILYATKQEQSYWTGKELYGSIGEAYIMSGAYPDNYLQEVFQPKEEKFYQYDKQGNEIGYEIVIVRPKKLSHKNQIEYDKMLIEGVRNWNLKGLNNMFSTFIKNQLGIGSEEEWAKNAFFQGYVQSTGKLKLDYLKEIAKILGITTEKKAPVVNVYQHGGKQIIDVAMEEADMEFLGNGIIEDKKET